MVGFLGLWLALVGVDLIDVLAGLATAAAATWASLRLLPPAPRRMQPLALLRLVVGFLPQSVAAGVDVARRAFDPRLPLRPGFVTFPTVLDSGSLRSGFCAFASLLPGTLPAGTQEDGTILVHCLDSGQPVQAQLSHDEALFAEALGVAGRDG
jgi:multicomponent Na+:H+ antiporter subunit E